MKTIIAGSRTIENSLLIDDATQKCGWKISEVICGMAHGVDMLGYAWAEKHNIPLKKCYADWDRYGKRAGYVRNVEMAEYADALILVWDGKSRGSKMMKDIAERKGMKIYEVIVS